MAQSARRPDGPRPHIVTVAVLKKSGKTTVVEALLAELRARGFRVASVKTIHSAVILDQEGTDTFRHLESGAEVVVALLENEIVRFERTSAPRSLDHVLDLVPAEIDYLICEGIVEPAASHMVILCLRSMAEREEALAIRGLDPASVIAISGLAAGGVGSAQALEAAPVFDVQDGRQKSALADIVIAAGKKKPGPMC
jgi:molybdopterin-guanine dinucleotide biosynthesis protein MobB